MTPIRITNPNTNRKYKMDVVKIKDQIELLKSKKNHFFGNHLTYSTKSGEKMFQKLLEVGVNCKIEPSKYKAESVDIIFLDV